MRDKRAEQALGQLKGAPTSAEQTKAQPMTDTNSKIDTEELRRQLLAIRTPVKWQGGKALEYDSIGNDDIIDEILSLFKARLNKLLLEARLSEVKKIRAVIPGGFQKVPSERIQEIERELE